MRVEALHRTRPRSKANLRQSKHVWDIQQGILDHKTYSNSVAGKLSMNLTARSSKSSSSGRLDTIVHTSTALLRLSDVYSIIFFRMPVNEGKSRTHLFVTSACQTRTSSCFLSLLVLYHVNRRIDISIYKSERIYSQKRYVQAMKIDQTYPSWKL